MGCGIKDMGYYRGWDIGWNNYGGWHLFSYRRLLFWIFLVRFFPNQAGVLSFTSSRIYSSDRAVLKLRTKQFG